MAVDMRERGTVGCSYYVAREEKLYFMEDVKFGSIETVDLCETIMLVHITMADIGRSEALYQSNSHSPLHASGRQRHEPPRPR